MKTINIVKSLYQKQTVLYAIWLYLDEQFKYELRDDENNFYLDIDWIDDKWIAEFKKNLNFTELRFAIASENKAIRTSIITKALWTVNYDNK
jgi:His-Xaa-Ser system protein HxsD